MNKDMWSQVKIDPKKVNHDKVKELIQRPLYSPPRPPEPKK